nr:MAG TPA: hypothetical protein [Caudoviricetes sp.]DAM37132.1 MAG TPA: hypothetical protein [Caudoviricetes sp.]
MVQKVFYSTTKRNWFSDGNEMGNVPPGVTPYGVKFPPSVIVTSPRGL